MKKIEKLKLTGETKEVFGWRGAFDELMPQLSVICLKIDELIDFITEMREEQVAQGKELYRQRDELEKRFIVLNMHSERLKNLESATEESDQGVKDLGCPWCGSFDVNFMNFGFPGSNSYRGYCLRCQAHNGTSDSLLEAKISWNRRAK
jgi:hypothetical protein